MFLIRICEKFAECGIPYALVGGYAVAIYGVIRGTIDVDILTDLSVENLSRVQEILEEMGLDSKIPLNAADVALNKEKLRKEKNLIAWSFQNSNKPHQIVDILLNYDVKNVQVNNIKYGRSLVSVISLEDLIRIKSASGRPQDMHDIAALKKINESNTNL